MFRKRDEMEARKKIDRLLRDASVSFFITIPILLLLVCLAGSMDFKTLVLAVEICWLIACVMFLIYYVPDTIKAFKKKEEKG